MLMIVTKELYEQVVESVKTHPNKCRELRHPNGVYYTRQYILNEIGGLVAFHDDEEGGGLRWADTSLLLTLTNV